MQCLVATFNVPLPGRLFVTRPEQQELQYDTTIDDFHVKIVLRPEGSFLQRSDHGIMWTVSTAQISVSRTEMTEPPPLSPTSSGGRNVADRVSYINKRLPAYCAAGSEALNRLLRFFKFRLAHPFLRDVSDHEFANPEWMDETGREIESGTLQVRSPLPAETVVYREVGIMRPLAEDNDPDLQLALTEPIQLHLYEELLSDAREALYQKNLRRAILEAAISCEVAVKHAFFAKSSVASTVFEYLEDKHRVNTRIVVDLLDEAAERAFGKSFKTVDKSAYDDIDHLFRCRNKIAHQGECSYRDNDGTHTVDLDTTKRWFKSIDFLLTWLNEVSV